MVRITAQQNHKIELIVNSIANVPRENDHSYEAGAQVDGADGVVVDLDITGSFDDNIGRNGDALPEDNLAPQLYDAQDKRVALTDKPCSTDNPCVFIVKQDREKGTVTLSSTLPGTYRWKIKVAPYDDSDYVNVTFLGAEIGGLNAFIRRVGAAKPSNLVDKDKESLPLNNIYRFVLWCDNSKDDVFQQVEKLTDEEMVQYDYKWGFTGKSIGGEVGTQTNTPNEDVVIPATNCEATQTYGA